MADYTSRPTLETILNRTGRQVRNFSKGAYDAFVPMAVMPYAFPTVARHFADEISAQEQRDPPAGAAELLGAGVGGLLGFTALAGQVFGYAMLAANDNPAWLLPSVPNAVSAAYEIKRYRGAKRLGEQ